MGEAFEFRLLGPLEARHDGLVAPVRAAKQRALLAALLADANRVVSVGELTERIWGEDPPGQSRGALHSYVGRLRRAVGGAHDPAPIVTHPDGYQITVHDDALDLLRFQSLLREAASPDAAADPARRVALLSAALSEWRGDPLSNIESEALHRQTVPVWVEQRLTALEQRIDAELRLGRSGELLAELRDLTTRYPLREHFHAQLILACYRSGRQADALAAYRSVRVHLAEELGVDPGVTLQRLHAQVLAADPVLSAHDYSVSEAWGTPRTRTAATAPRNGTVVEPRGNRAAPRGARPAPAELPPDIADFTGRDDTVARIEHLLAPPYGTGHGATAICVIGGAGGIGKTALAVHAAHRLRDSFPDGQLYINLRGAGDAPISPADALARLLRSLGIDDRAVPHDQEERAALYRSLLAARRVLVVLDDARAAEQVCQLLPGTASSAALVTSRNRMATLDAAHRIELGVLGADEARALLVGVVGASRAAAEPDAVEAVLACCAGLPLAIRLAAARLASRPDWTMSTLAERLADEGRRLDELQAEDRAVRASFAVSYAALPDPPNADAADPARAFRLVSLADGPDIDLLAAAALLGQPREPAAEALGVLVQAHLLQSPSRARYRYHDLLRLYGRELAAATDSEADRAGAVTRSLTWYSRAAGAAMDTLHPYEKHRRPRHDAAAEPAPPVQDAAEARAWLEREHANLLAVATTAAPHGHPVVAGELSMTLWRHLMTVGRHNDALILHNAALENCTQTGDAYGQARALSALGLTYWRLGRNSEAMSAYGRSRELFRAHGHRHDEGITLTNLGLVYWHLGRFQEAMEHHRQSLAVARETENRFNEANALGNLGSVYGRLGRFEEALETLQQALALQREAGNRPNETVVLTSLGLVYARLGRGEEGLAHLHRALELAREADNRTGENETLRTIAAVYRDLGRFEEAFQHYRNVLTRAEEVGSPDLESIVRNGYGQTLCAVGRHTEGGEQHELALELSEQTGDRYQQAIAIDGLARAAHAAGRRDEARTLWRDALARYSQMGVPEADAVRESLARLN